MKKTENKYNIDAVFVLILFAIFAACVLMVLLFGASSYKNLVNQDAASYEQRVAVEYIAAKIRHNDESNAVSIGSFTDRKDITADEYNTLYLKLEVEEELYYTKIYYYDGYIREVLSVDGVDLSPDDGNKILKAKGLFLKQDDSMVTITVINEDESISELQLAVRSSQEDIEW